MASPPAGTLDRLLPGLAVLRRYERSWLRPDLLAGLTVGAMLVPQAMAYAELAGLAPQYGFYAALGALAVYALVGTSRHLGVGPEPGTAILAATGVGAVAGGDPDRYVALMAALALVVAAICVVGAVARLGFLASLLSTPVLVGYITGVGLTLLSSQLRALTGVPVDADSFGRRMVQFLTGLDQVQPATLAVGLGTLAVVLGLRRWAPRWPGALVGVVAATVAVAVLDPGGVALVGEVPAGLPTPGLPGVGWDDVVALLPVAAGIALVGYTDNVLTARAVAVRHGYRIDPNRELLALGLTNLTAGLSQGFPVSSSASRTAVPSSLGSRTQLVGLVAGGSVLVSLVALRDALARIPQPALAAVIVAAAVAIIDVDGFRRLRRVAPEEAALAAATVLAVLVLDVLVGVLVAVGLSVLVALYRIARPHDAVLGDHPGVDGWVEVDQYPEARPEPGLVVYRFDSPLFFLNVDRYAERLSAALEDSPGRESWVVLDFEGIGALDATAAGGLVELVDRLQAEQVEVLAVSRANDRVLERLRRAGLLGPDGPLRTFPTINSAVRAYRERPDQVDPPGPVGPEGPAD